MSENEYTIPAKFRDGISISAGGNAEYEISVLNEAIESAF